MLTTVKAQTVCPKMNHICRRSQWALPPVLGSRITLKFNKYRQHKATNIMYDHVQIQSCLHFRNILMCLILQYMKLLPPGQMDTTTVIYSLYEDPEYERSALQQPPGAHPQYWGRGTRDSGNCRDTDVCEEPNQSKRQPTSSPSQICSMPPNNYRQDSAESHSVLGPHLVRTADKVIHTFIWMLRIFKARCSWGDGKKKSNSKPCIKSTFLRKWRRGKINKKRTRT